MSRLGKGFSMKYRVLLYVFILVLPLTIVVGAVALSQIGETRSRLVENERMNLSLIVSPLNVRTAEIEGSILKAVQNNPAFRALAEESSDTQLYALSYEIIDSLDTTKNAYADVSFLIIYSEENDYFLAADNGLDYLSVAQRIALRTATERWFIRSYHLQQLVFTRWFVAEIGERWFLCRNVRSEGGICAAVIDLQRLSENIVSEHELDGAIVFRDGDHLLTESSPPFEISNQNALALAAESVSSVEYFAVSEEVCGISLTYIFTLTGLAGFMSSSSMLLAIIAVLITACLPIIYRSLKKSFFTPLDNLMDTMGRIQSGDVNLLADDQNAGREFRQVNETFNQMLFEIRNLRIEQYESELEARQSKLQFLQAQIRPHFYLNCLKTLYSLTKQNNSADMGRGILLISNHLRYAFTQSEEAVPLREEIRLCDNYVKLCALLTGEEPRLELDIEGALFEAPIPPVSLLTFVENSMRFGLKPEIRISVRRLDTEDGGVLCITVRDNGPGFTHEQLASFNGSAWYDKLSEHVGIQNVIRRFRLIYGDKFAFAFSNQGGARQELYIPIADKEVHCEASDC